MSETSCLIALEASVYANAAPVEPHVASSASAAEERNFVCRDLEGY